MKTLLLLATVAFVTGCEKPSPPARYQLVFPPQHAKVQGEMYLLDTQTGKLWEKGVDKHVKFPDGNEELVYGSWIEVTPQKSH